jgi:hypothetical protein
MIHDVQLIMRSDGWNESLTKKIKIQVIVSREVLFKTKNFSRLILSVIVALHLVF